MSPFYRLVRYYVLIDISGMMSIYIFSVSVLSETYVILGHFIILSDIM
jgi:hypothetical protein